MLEPLVNPPSVKVQHPPLADDGGAADLAGGGSSGGEKSSQGGIIKGNEARQNNQHKHKRFQSLENVSLSQGEDEDNEGERGERELRSQSESCVLNRQHKHQPFQSLPELNAPQGEDEDNEGEERIHLIRRTQSEEFVCNSAGNPIRSSHRIQARAPCSRKHNDSDSSAGRTKYFVFQRCDDGDIIEQVCMHTITQQTTLYKYSQISESPI